MSLDKSCGSNLAKIVKMGLKKFKGEFCPVGPNGSKWVQMGPNGSKWVQIGPNGSNGVQMGQMVQMGPISLSIDMINHDNILVVT